MTRSRYFCLIALVPLVLGLCWAHRATAGARALLGPSRHRGQPRPAGAAGGGGSPRRGGRPAPPPRRGGPNSPDRTTLDTPLIAACGFDHPETMALLLARGARIPSQAGGFDMISAACVRGDAESAALLLDHGADPNERGRNGRTAMMRILIGAQNLGYMRAQLAAAPSHGQGQVAVRVQRLVRGTAA